MFAAYRGRRARGLHPRQVDEADPFCLTVAAFELSVSSQRIPEPCYPQVAQAPHARSSARFRTRNTHLANRRRTKVLPSMAGPIRTATGPTGGPITRDRVFSALTRTRLGKYLLPSYDYMFSPSQLSLLAAELERTDGIEGSILEVGCASGATTVFLNQHLEWIGSAKRYFALDTFSGFLRDDVEMEEQRRGRDEYSFTHFQRNSLAMFERTLRLNDIRRVTAIKADAKRFDYSGIAPISFCVVDVDLYVPVFATLAAVYELMSPGGVIIVDDCDPDSAMWRGAYEAYAEFVETTGDRKDIRQRKLGFIQR